MSVQDHVGEYTTILTDSHLHTETIQKRLTPAIGEKKIARYFYFLISSNHILIHWLLIGRLIPRITSELDYAFKVEFPDCEGKLPPFNKSRIDRRGSNLCNLDHL